MGAIVGIKWRNVGQGHCWALLCHPRPTHGSEHLLGDMILGCFNWALCPFFAVGHRWHPIVCLRTFHHWGRHEQEVKVCPHYVDRRECQRATASQNWHGQDPGERSRAGNWPVFFQDLGVTPTKGHYPAAMERAGFGSWACDLAVTSRKPCSISGPSQLLVKCYQNCFQEVG